MSQQKQQQQQQQQQGQQPSRGGSSAFDSLWSSSFGTADEVTWDQFSSAIKAAFGVDYAEGGYSDSVYCIANIFAGGCKVAFFKAYITYFFC